MAGKSPEEDNVRYPSHQTIIDYGDMRQWLEQVALLGELQPVAGTHWDKEIGAISQINYRRRPNQALLFDQITDYLPGFQVLTSSMGSTRRLALAFRFP